MENLRIVDALRRLCWITLLGVILAPSLSAAQVQSPTGFWKTIDDTTHKPRALVHIIAVNGELNGTIEKLFLEPNEDQNPKCVECTDARRDQPIIGMAFLTGLKKDGEGRVWSGGQILDPDSGKIYRSKATLSEDGKSLEVRGFIGFALLGRSQTWVRAE